MIITCVGSTIFGPRRVQSDFMLRSQDSISNCGPNENHPIQNNASQYVMADLFPH
jgi:hypothetical protein